MSSRGVRELESIKEAVGPLLQAIEGVGSFQDVETKDRDAVQRRSAHLTALSRLMGDDDDEDDGVNEELQSSNTRRSEVPQLEIAMQHKSASKAFSSAPDDGEAELIVAVRMVRRMGVLEKKAADGCTAYLKMELDAFSRKTEGFRFSMDGAGIEDVCHFPESKYNISQDRLLHVRLKVGGRSIFSGITIGTLSVRVKEIALVGSPEVFAPYPILRTEDNVKIAEIEMSIFWCHVTEVPSGGSPMEKIGTRDHIKRRVFKHRYTSGKTLGLDEVSKGPGWVSNQSGIAEWHRYSKLSVHVIQAENLRAADLNGLSDPYCIVMCRGVRDKTKVIKRDRHPSWDKWFDFSSIEGVDEDDEITFIIRDSDRLGRNDDLGQLIIPIWAVMRARHAEPEWFDLTPTPRMRSSKDPNYGRLRIQVLFRPKDENFRPALGIGSPLSPRSAGSGGSGNNWGSILDHSLIGSNDDRPHLYIRILQARHLQAADANGWSDPYAHVKCKRVSFRTRTLRKTLAPKWNQTFHFGEKDFLSETDEVRITIYDRDKSLSEGVVDEKLGRATIPIYQLINQPKPEMPTWFPLKSERFTCAGEIQVACQFVFPDSLAGEKAMEARALYKGLEHLYELQITLLSGRHLHAADSQKHVSDPYATISCGAKKRVKSRTRRKTVNPIWNQFFKFRESVDAERQGLGRMDPVKIDVWSEGAKGEDVALGTLAFDLGWLIDRMGYVDKKGAEITDFFPLSKPNVQEMEVEEVMDAFVEEDDRSPSAGLQTSPHGGAVANSPRSTKFLSGWRKVFVRSAENLGNSISAESKVIQNNGITEEDLTIPLELVDAHPSNTLRSVDPSLPDEEDVNFTRTSSEDEGRMVEEGSKASSSSVPHSQEPWGAIRIKFRLVPIGEKRMEESEKVLLKVKYLVDVAQEPLERSPKNLYLKVEVGYETYESTEVEFRNHLGGVAVFNSQFVFENWRNALSRAVKAEKKGSSVGATLFRISAVNPSTDCSVATCRLRASEFQAYLKKLEGGPSEFTLPMTLSNGNRAIAKAEMAKVKVFQELKPVLGHFHLNVISLKIKRDDYNRTYRTIVRYRGRIVTTRGVSGDLSINYAKDKDNHKYTFQVYEMFSPVLIEVYASSNGEDEGERVKASKWGKLMGSIEISMFDMLELEAQVVHSDTRLTDGIPLPRLKLPVINAKGKINGSMWVEAMFEEQFWEAIKPNPHPTMHPMPSFSLANLRHEINRTLAILGWFSQIGSNIGYLLDWQSKSTSLFAVFLVIVFCCIDFYSERVLMIPIYVLLLRMLRSHHDRVDGTLVHQMQVDVSTEEVNARVRVAVLAAEGLVIDNEAERRRFRYGSDAGLLGLEAFPWHSVLELADPTRRSHLTEEDSIDFSDEFTETNEPQPRRLISKRRQAAGEMVTPRSGSIRRPILRIFDSMTKPMNLIRNVSGQKGPRAETLSEAEIEEEEDNEEQDAAKALPPSAFARVSLRKRLGQKHMLRIGQTRKSAPTTAPDFIQSKKGYIISRGNREKLKNELIEWECTDKNGAVLPAFQADVKLFPAGGKLVVVRLYRALNLLPGDRDGRSDPYALVQTVSTTSTTRRGAAPKNVHRTKTLPHTLNPTWNQEFVLGTQVSVQSSDNVQIVFCDSDGVTTHDDVLGVIDLPVNQIPLLFGNAAMRFQQQQQQQAGESTQSLSTFLGSDGPIWLDVEAPPNNHLQRKSFGRALVSMHVVDLSSDLGGLRLLSISNTNPWNSFRLQDKDVSGTSKPEIVKKPSDQVNSPDSWKRSASELVVEIFNSTAPEKERSFLGCARIPLAALVTDENQLVQPTFEEWLPLTMHLDGGHSDEFLEQVLTASGKPDLGKVLARVELVLPDPKVRERLIELEEAKRADNASPIKKFLLIQQKLADFQNALFMWNNKMERTKNLFNWSHPRITQYLFWFVVILAVVFTLVPSRYIVMFITLFMFTEHFRRQGTAALRFNHLLTLMPTDDDLVEACNGGVLSAKKKNPSEWVDKERIALEKGDFEPVLSATPDLFSQDRLRQISLASAKSLRTYPVELTAEEIDQGFSGTLRMQTCQSSSLGFSFNSPSRLKWTSYFFFISVDDKALVWWQSKDQFSDALDSPMGKFGDIVAIETDLFGQDLGSCTRPELAFSLYRQKLTDSAKIQIARPRPNKSRDSNSLPSLDDTPLQNQIDLDKIILVANSVHKKRAWIENLVKHLQDPTPP